MSELIPLPPNNPTAMCRRCGKRVDLVEHDGPVVVCRSCIRALGELAADPNGTEERVLAVMQERHGDVVLLTRHGRPGRPVRLDWDWIGW